MGSHHGDQRRHLRDLTRSGGPLRDREDGTVWIPIGTGGWAVVDATDRGLVEGASWKLVTRPGGSARVVGRYRGVSPQRWVTLGRVILGLGSGTGDGRGLRVRHRNGDPTDLRRANLEAVTPSAAQFPVADRIDAWVGRSASGARGVYPVPRRAREPEGAPVRWRYGIELHGRVYSGAPFATVEEAATAREARLAELLSAAAPSSGSQPGR